MRFLYSITTLWTFLFLAWGTLAVTRLSAIECGWAVVSSVGIGVLTLLHWTIVFSELVNGDGFKGDS